MPPRDAVSFYLKDVVDNTPFAGKADVKSYRLRNVPTLLNGPLPPVHGSMVVVYGEDDQQHHYGEKPLHPSVIGVLRYMPPIRGKEVYWSPDNGFAVKAGDAGLTYPRLELGFRSGSDLEYVVVGQNLKYVMVFNRFEADENGNQHPIGMFRLGLWLRFLLGVLIVIHEKVD